MVRTTRESPRETGLTTRVHTGVLFERGGSETRLKCRRDSGWGRGVNDFEVGRTGLEDSRTGEGTRGKKGLVIAEDYQVGPDPDSTGPASIHPLYPNRTLHEVSG